MKAMKKLIVLILAGFAGCSTPNPKTDSAPAQVVTPMPPLPPGAKLVKARSASLMLTSAPRVSAAAAPMLMTLGEPLDPCAPRAWVETNAVHLYWPCSTNVNFRIDTSTDLFNWQIVGTSLNVTNTGPVTNVITIVDATAAYHAARYYRVVPVDTNGVRLQ
jgi:hypothetical protein